MQISGFISLFEQVANSTRPSKPFITAPLPLTYCDLFDRVRRLTTLFHDMRLKPGCRVIVASADDGSVITLFMATPDRY